MLEHVHGHGPTTWQRLRRKAREVGPAYLSQILLQRLIPRRLLRIRSLLFFDTELRAEGVPQGHEPDIRWATPDDLEALAAFGRNRTEVEGRLASGARALIAERDGRMIGEGWFRTSYCDMDDWLRFTGPRDAVWMISVKVAPEHRGQRFHPRMKMFGASDYARAGYRHVLSWIEELNRNSQRGSRKTGSRLIGRMLTVRFLGFGAVYMDGRLKLGRWHAGRRLELPIDHFLRNRGN